MIVRLICCGDHVCKGWWLRAHVSMAGNAKPCGELHVQCTTRTHTYVGEEGGMQAHADGTAAPYCWYEPRVIRATCLRGHVRAGQLRAARANGGKVSAMAPTAMESSHRQYMIAAEGDGTPGQWQACVPLPVRAGRGPITRPATSHPSWPKCLLNPTPTTLLEAFGFAAPTHPQPTSWLYAMGPSQPS